MQSATSGARLFTFASEVLDLRFAYFSEDQVRVPWGPLEAFGARGWGSKQKP